MFKGNSPEPGLEGKDIREAFYSAQREMSEKYEPFYRAAFVLVE